MAQSNSKLTSPIELYIYILHEKGVPLHYVLEDGVEKRDLLLACLLLYYVKRLKKRVKQTNHSGTVDWINEEKVGEFLRTRVGVKQ